MSRLVTALITDAYGKDANQPMLDLAMGGQHGYAPNLKELISNQAYVRRNLICILLEAPKFFDVMPNHEKWKASLKSLVEQHARSIEGLNAELTVETDTHPVGGGGELQDEITDVKRARSEPTFTFIEKYGLPIQTFIYNWITYGMMDPDTKYALAGTLGSNAPTNMLMDQYSMSCLFFEPDPTHTKVVKSWVTTNMFPKSTGAIEGKRDLTTGGEVLNLSIAFTGVSQFNLGTNIFAQTILNQMNLENANPYLRPSFIQGIDNKVSAATDTGYMHNVSDLATSAIKR